jgi:hypothetical protein
MGDDKRDEDDVLPFPRNRLGTPGWFAISFFGGLLTQGCLWVWSFRYAPNSGLEALLDMVFFAPFSIGFVGFLLFFMVTPHFETKIPDFLRDSLWGRAIVVFIGLIFGSFSSTAVMIIIIGAIM